MSNEMRTRFWIWGVSPFSGEVWLSCHELALHLHFDYLHSDIATRNTGVGNLMLNCSLIFKTAQLIESCVDRILGSRMTYGSWLGQTSFSSDVDVYMPRTFQ
jgi:hypothetical protein